MGVGQFRLFRGEDAARLVAALKAQGVSVYRHWHSSGFVCVSPVDIKPRFIIVDSRGVVSIQDPLLSHPSTPHLTPLGTVELQKRQWPSEASTLYTRPVAVAAPVAEPEPVPAPTPPAPPPSPSWCPALSQQGPVVGLEVTQEGDVRWTDGHPVKWDSTRPSRIRAGGRHQDLHLPDIILCTFVGPPPSPLFRATYRNTKLEGTVRQWAAVNLQWSSRRPSRPRLTEGQVLRIFADFAKGKTPTQIGNEMHVASTSVSGIIRGFTHPDKDQLRKWCVAERERNKLPEDSIVRYVKKRLHLA